MIFLYFLKLLFCLLFILLSVAFLTLLERKILGYGHMRLGPNKNFLVGSFQPFNDAIKLFSKENIKVEILYYNVYIFFCFFCLLLSMFFFGVYSFWGILFYSMYSLIYFICIIGMGVYFLLFMGWASGSKFSVLGSYRSSAQSISYEIILIFCLLFFFYYWFSFNFMDLYYFNYGVSMLFLFLNIFFMWFFSCLAECNRSPFDFSEGESELVSGFNTEYGSGYFSLIFIGEYLMIIIFSFLSSFFFTSYMYMFIFFSFISFFYLWVRLSFPRFRYDFLMYLAWKSLSFLLLSYFFLMFFIFF